jgi:pimeloyl-ACP methyl ester carboxylesterase
VLLTLCCAGCGGHRSVRTRPVPGEPGLQYEVDGSFLYLLCAGHGSPTVVLEAGLGGDHRVWSLVQPEVARTTRVCSYDRSGLWFSQLAPKRRLAREKAKDLHALLAAAGVTGPYVLVGHSYGGMLVRVYAAAYAKDVAGLVLLDSSHPDQSSRFLAALPPRRTGEPRPLRQLRKDLAETPPNPEGVDWSGSSAQTRAAGPIGDKPLIVVTAGQSDTPPEFAGLPGVVRRLNDAWLRMQNDLARLSPNSLHVIAVDSPHFVMSALGQPELVIHAIRAVVRATRSHLHLPRCRSLFAPPAAECLGT